MSKKIDTKPLDDKKPVKDKKPSEFQNLLKKLNIDETFTSKINYKFPKVKDVTFPQKGYNFMCDLLMLPETKEKYRYLFVIVDLWSNHFDIEPMKTKTAESALMALKRILKRGKYIKHIEASVRTDSGGEFKGSFHKYLYDNNIHQRVSLPDRHKQLGNVENLNKQLGRLFMTYLTNKEMQTKQPYYEWTDILDQVRDGLNEIKKHPADLNPNTYKVKEPDLGEPPKYKVGDLVYQPLEKAKNINQVDSNYNNSRFRMGDSRFDNVPRKIVKVFVYSSPNPYRYSLDGFPNVSYAEDELRFAHGETQEKWVVQRIRDKRKNGNKIEYQIVWKGYKVSQATWESRTELIKDGCKPLIDEFEKKLKENTKK